MLTNEEIRKVFLDCENTHPDGLYATDIDIFEFGRKLIDVVAVKVQRAEREFCVSIVRDLNSEVAKVLATQPEVNHHVAPIVSKDGP